MANWKHKINVNKHIHEWEDDKITVVELGKRVAEECKRIPLLVEEDFPQRFIDASETEDTDEFDAVLSDLYDIADENLIWLGL